MQKISNDYLLFFPRSVRFQATNTCLPLKQAHVGYSTHSHISVSVYLSVLLTALYWFQYLPFMWLNFFLTFIRYFLLRRRRASSLFALSTLVVSSVCLLFAVVLIWVKVNLVDLVDFAFSEKENYSIFVFVRFMQIYLVMLVSGVVSRFVS